MSVPGHGVLGRRVALARYALETPNLFGVDPGARGARHDVFGRLRAGWPEL